MEWGEEHPVRGDSPRAPCRASAVPPAHSPGASLDVLGETLGICLGRGRWPGSQLTGPRTPLAEAGH